VEILTVTSTDTSRWQVIFAPAQTADAHYEIHAALTAWVTRAGELEPVQSTGGWLVAPGKK
jgi:hypothetical protein